MGTQLNEIRRQCARCSWTGSHDDRGAVMLLLADHAAEAGHPLCSVCARSLTPEETHTCLRCIGVVRRDLGEVVDLYALLPAELGVIRGHDYTRTSVTSSSDETRIDDALVMLGPGSVGSVTVTYTVVGSLTSANHGMNLPSDPESVAHTLSMWEDDWRQRRHEPAAPDQPTVSAASAYLMVRLTWAGQEHPAFPDFAEDVHRIHRRLQNATRSGDAPATSDVPCFDCGRPRLEQSYAHPRPCHHTPPPRLVVGVTVDGAPIPEPLGTYRQRCLLWQRKHPCEQGGRVSVWTCAACHRRYSEAEFYLAVAAHLEAAALTEEGVEA